jgi:hypothetical protein
MDVSDSHQVLKVVEHAMKNIPKKKVVQKAVKKASTKKTVKKGVVKKTAAVPRPLKKAAAGTRATTAASSNIDVQKATTHVDLKFRPPQSTVVYGSPLTITAVSTRRSTGLPVSIPLTLTVGKQKHKDQSDSFGTARFTVKTTRALNPGDHEMTVSFAGDQDFLPAKATANLKVFQANSTLRAFAQPLSGGRYELRAELTGQAGEAGFSRSIEFIINKESRGITETDAKGIARRTYKPTVSQGNTLEVRFAGDKTYKKSSGKVNF